MPARGRPDRSTRRNGAIAAAALLGVLTAGLLTVHGTAAAFVRTTASTGTFASATVGIGDDDGGTALVTSSARLVPGTSYQRCVAVTYTGSTAASVKLYAANVTDSEGFGAATTLTVEQGSGGGFGSCAGFVAASTLYSGRLSTFLSTVTSPATGVGAWSPTGTGQSRVYRFTTRLDAGASGALQTAATTVTVTWVAQAGS